MLRHISTPPENRKWDTIVVGKEFCERSVRLKFFPEKPPSFEKPGPPEEKSRLEGGRESQYPSKAVRFELVAKTRSDSPACCACAEGANEKI